MAHSCGGSGGSNEAQQAMLAQQDNAITRSLGKIKNKILVMSGKGGVGKSTVSVNLALSLAKNGHKVGLMDVDIHGPDVIRMLNMTGTLEPPASEKDLVEPLKYDDNLKVVSLEYMMKDRDEAIIWRGPLKIQAIRQFVADFNWGDLDYLIIDAPPAPVMSRSPLPRPYRCSKPSWLPRLRRLPWPMSENRSISAKRSTSVLSASSKTCPVLSAPTATKRSTSSSRAAVSR